MDKKSKTEKEIYEKWYKKKIIIIIIGILLVLSIIFMTSSLGRIFLNKTVDKYLNSNIDYSCQTDLDCSIKKIGCDCSGSKYSCVNKESSSGVCMLNQFGCEKVNLKPNNCKCINNMCKDVFE